MPKHKTHHYATGKEKQEEEIGSYMSTPVISVDIETSVQDTVALMETKT